MNDAENDKRVSVGALLRKHRAPLVRILISWLLAWLGLWCASRGYNVASKLAFTLYLVGNLGPFMVAVLLSAPTIWLGLSTREMALIVYGMSLILVVPNWFVWVKGTRMLREEGRNWWRRSAAARPGKRE